MDKDKLKTVLLIGDSIRMGYCNTVREELKGNAETVFPVENCRNSQYIIASLDRWKSLCEPENVAVVHFNCGHWDIAHFGKDEESLTSICEYKRNINQIIRRLKAVYKNAEIIFSTTTTVDENAPVGINHRTNNEIKAYNTAAAGVCLSADVCINDLYSISKSFNSSLYVDFCHFTAEGYSILGKATAEFILNYIR